MGIIGDIIGGIADLGNFGYNIATNERNFEYTKQLNQQAQQNWQTEFNYNKALNEQAQRNWQLNMDFQKAQAQQQQSNLELNRIGNLTKEYAEAGLNPMLAAGMGASTASTVASGGSANTHPITGGANTHLAPMQQAELKLANMQAITQINQSKANIDLTEAQKNLVNAQATTEKLKPELIKAETEKMIKDAKLTEEQIESYNYRQIEEKIRAEFIKQHPELKEKEIKAELEKQDLENKLTKAKTAREKAEIVYGAIRGILQGIATGASIAMGGAFSTPTIIGFH